MRKPSGLVVLLPLLLAAGLSMASPGVRPAEGSPEPAPAIPVPGLGGDGAPLRGVVLRSVAGLADVLPIGVASAGVGLLGGLLALLLYTRLRRSRLVVRLTIAPGMQGRFRVRVARDPLPPYLHGSLDPRSTSRARLGGRIFRLEAAAPVVLDGIGPGSWFVAVGGYVARPVDEKTIGEFREEKAIRIAPRRSREVLFDFRPRFARLDVRLVAGGTPLRGARVAREGTETGIGSTGLDGRLRLDVPFGTSWLVIGHEGRVVRIPVEVVPDGPDRLEIDLDSVPDVVIANCPDAVDGALRGDAQAVARALEDAGQRQAAYRFRGAHRRARGELTEAVEEFVKGGELLGAAEILESLGRWEEAGAAYLQAERPLQAAALFTRNGAWERAGNAYECAFLYEKAADCYTREDLYDRALPLLERAGLHLRAAEAALRVGDPQRATELFARVPLRHPDHDAARCRLEELAGRGWRPSGDAPERNGHAVPAPRAPEPDLPTPRQPRSTEAEEEDTATAPTLEATDVSVVPAGAARRYEILEELGRGSMGIVFKAYDRALCRTVALKRLPRWMADAPRAVALFLEEARAAASLSHPHIVTIHDVVREAGTYFLTMEYLDGVTLQFIAREQGARAAKDVVRIARQVLSALAYAHGRGMIHRDVKSQNLMTTAHGAVKLTDFGLSRVTAEASPQGGGWGGGTPHYMAPEQIEGQGDARSDLYSLGITLFELTTGELPFTGPDVLDQHRNAPRPRAGESAAGCPPLLVDVIRRLMAVDPEDRFQSAEEVMGVLEWLDR